MNSLTDAEREELESFRRKKEKQLKYMREYMREYFKKNPGKAKANARTRYEKVKRILAAAKKAGITGD